MKLKKTAALPVTLVMAMLLALPLAACGDESVVRHTVAAPSLEGNLLGESVEQEIAVVLPANYSEQGDPYPVLYFLPGFSGNHNQVAGMLSQAVKAQPAGAQSASAQPTSVQPASAQPASAQPASAQPMIIVVINGTNALGGCFYVNSPVTGNWMDYVAQDVVGYVESNYHTVAEPWGRGIAGHSMGGFGAINLALNQPGMFGHVYSMSPGLFDAEGLAHSGINFIALREGMERYKDMPASEALPAYVRDVKAMSWPNDFSFAYASAFAYDPLAPLPYIEAPLLGFGVAFIDDTGYSRYLAGFGGWEEKLAEQGDNLRALQSFTVEYGEQDELTWIPEGARHFCSLLAEEGIGHEELPFEGGHVNRLQERFNDYVVPFFIEGFAAGTVE